MFDISIPKISDEDMMERYSHIKPLVRVEGKLHHLREFTLDEIKNTTFCADDVREEVGDFEHKVFKNQDFLCLHKYVFPVFFNPSVGEVLSQIDENILSLVKAFEIIEEPSLAGNGDYTTFEGMAFRKGFHVSKVRLYM